MALKLQITKDFLDMTNIMIDTVKTKQVTMENGNLLLMKIPIKNTSTIRLVEGKFTQNHKYQAGVARVIGVPRLLNEDTDAKVAVGDFVIYSHAAKYTLSPLIVEMLFGIKLEENDSPLDFVEENNSAPLITITDPDVLAVVPPNSLEMVAGE